jgi:hypothetical protein
MTDAGTGVVLDHLGLALVRLRVLPPAQRSYSVIQGRSSSGERTIKLTMITVLTRYEWRDQKPDRHPVEKQHGNS